MWPRIPLQNGCTGIGKELSSCVCHKWMNREPLFFKSSFPPALPFFNLDLQSRMPLKPAVDIGWWLVSDWMWTSLTWKWQWNYRERPYHSNAITGWIGYVFSCIYSLGYVPLKESQDWINMESASSLLSIDLPLAYPLHQFFVQFAELSRGNRNT